MCCIRNDIRVVDRDLAPHIAQADGANAKRSSAHRVAAKGCGRPHHINGVLRRACGSKWPGARRFAMSIVSQYFWAESVGVLGDAVAVYLAGRCWAVTFPGRVPPPACRRRCPAGYGTIASRSRASIWVNLRRVTERHSGGNLSAPIMLDRWRATVSVKTRRSGETSGTRSLTGNQKQRTTIGILGAHSSGRSAIQVADGGLKQRLCRRGTRVCLE